MYIKSDLVDQKIQLNLNFEVGDLVLKKIVVPSPDRPKKIYDKFEGPFEIVEKHSNLNYTIYNACKNSNEQVHISLLLKFHAYIPDSDDESVFSYSTFVSEINSESDDSNCINTDDKILSLDCIENDRFSPNGLGIEYLYNTGVDKIWLLEEYIPPSVLKSYKNKNTK